MTPVQRNGSNTPSPMKVEAKPGFVRITQDGVEARVSKGTEANVTMVRDQLMIPYGDKYVLSVGDKTRLGLLAKPAEVGVIPGDSLVLRSSYGVRAERDMNKTTNAFVEGKAGINLAGTKAVGTSVGLDAAAAMGLEFEGLAEVNVHTQASTNGFSGVGAGLTLRF